MDEREWGRSAALASDAQIIGRWIAKLDDRVDDLMLSVQFDDLTRASWAAESLRSWLSMMELMLMESTGHSPESDVFGQFAARLAIIDARLNSIKWLIERKQQPWYARYLPWLSRIGDFLLNLFGNGILRLPSGK